MGIIINAKEKSLITCFSTYRLIWLFWLWSSSQFTNHPSNQNHGRRQNEPSKCLYLLYMGETKLLIIVTLDGSLTYSGLVKKRDSMRGWCFSTWLVENIFIAKSDWIIFIVFVYYLCCCLSIGTFLCFQNFVHECPFMFGYVGKRVKKQMDSKLQWPLISKILDFPL